MTTGTFSGIRRRDFLKAAGAVTAFGLAHSAFAEAGGRVFILIDAGDAIASAAPVRRAAERLRNAPVSYTHLRRQSHGRDRRPPWTTRRAPPLQETAKRAR